MATYCVGDLHGRFDLFCSLLHKINFDPKQDKLYLLGDVIDWNYGGIKIIDYIMDHPDACTLIMGNHEHHFLYMERAYDAVMHNPAIKKVMIAAVEVYSESLFDTISYSFERKLSAKKREQFYTQPTIKKWLKEGDFRIRSRLLNTMVDMAEQCGFDKDVYRNVKWILSNLSGRYKTKAFVQELLEQDEEHYVAIKHYLKKCPNCVDLNFTDTHYHLTHWKGSLHQAAYRFDFPSTATNNVTYIFGHDPVPLLHRTLQSHCNSFEFSYRNIFSWIDTQNNRYYNLDLASNPIAALKLEDMSEYYVGAPSNRKNANKWEVPRDVIAPPPTEYQYVDYARIGMATFINAAITTKRTGCFEFLIGISSYSKTIHYVRIGWLDFKHAFVIGNWLENQSIEEIIEKVREDFGKRQISADYKPIEKWLQGISVTSNCEPHN